MHKSRTATAFVAAVGFVLFSAPLAFGQPGGPPPQGPPLSTQPGYYAAPPPPPQAYGPGQYVRRGLTLGGSFGVGDMVGEKGPIECFNCDYNPLAFTADFHIGAMLNPRLALLFESSITGKTLEANGTETLLQYAGYIAAQYWVTPRLWIKGGIGGAHLTLQIDDGAFITEDSVANGGAVLGAVGYEVMAGPHFSIDLQLRGASAAYGELGESIQTGSFGLGFNWY